MQIRWSSIYEKKNQANEGVNDSVMFIFKGVDNTVKSQASVMNELREETKGFCSTTI